RQHARGFGRVLRLRGRELILSLGSGGMLVAAIPADGGDRRDRDSEKPNADDTNAPPLLSLGRHVLGAGPNEDFLSVGERFRTFLEERLSLAQRFAAQEIVRV